MNRFAACAALILGLTSACGETEPTGDGTSAEPRATKIPLDRWAQRAVPGFKQTSGKVAAAGATSSYRSVKRTGGGATLQVRVTVGPCTPARCAPLELTSPDDHERLTRNLNPKHVNNPDLMVQSGLFDIGPGRLGMFVWARSYLEEQQGRGTRRLTAHLFQAWHHDGTRMIEFTIEPRGRERVTSDAVLARQMTPAEAKKAVQTIFAEFAAAFD